MAKVIYKGINDTVYIEGDLKMEHSTDNTSIDTILADLLTLHGLDESHKRVSAPFNADDSAYHFAAVGVEPKYKIPMLPNVSYSSETQFGFMALPLTSASTNISSSASRSYMSSPTPPVVFSTGYRQDGRSELSAIWTKPGVAIIRVRHRHHSNTTGQQDIILVMNNDQFKWYCRRTGGSGSWAMTADTYSHLTNLTSPVNKYVMGTLYEGGNTTEVTLKLQTEVHPEGSWSSPPIETGSLTHLVSSSVTWDVTLPTGTSVVVNIKMPDNTWKPIANGGPIPYLVAEQEVINAKVELQVMLTTTNIDVAPEVSNMQIKMVGFRESHFVELSMDAFNLFRNVEGPLTVTYEQNLGVIQGDGGYVESFSNQFTPTGLVPNPTPGVYDTVSISAIPSITLTDVYYSEASSKQISKVTLSLTANLVLTTVGVIDP